MRINYFTEHAEITIISKWYKIGNKVNFLSYELLENRNGHKHRKARTVQMTLNFS